MNPSNCPWGQKALTGYLGDDKQRWQQYDATELLSHYVSPTKRPILIEQGSSDQFLDEQLKPWLFEQAAEKAGYPITLNMHEGYDHSYFFISSFIENHLEFHANYMR